MFRVGLSVHPFDRTYNTRGRTREVRPPSGTVLPVDTDWARTKLENFLKACEEYERRDGPEWVESSMRPIVDLIETQLPTVRRIINALDPDLLTENFGQGLLYIGMRESASATRMALAVLKDHDEWKTMLAPDAPVLSAGELHPLIWSAAAPLWDTGEYKTAAQQAAVNLSAHVKARVGSHLNERELVQYVFSPDLPRPGQARLHLPGDRADKNWKSAQEGLHLIAQGAFAGIRNIAVHGPEQWTEHEALENLAVLSVVARWADLTEERR